MKIRFRKWGNFGLFVALILMLFSCVPTKQILIEIPRKAKNELPQNIQSLTIVSRMVDNSYTNLDTDSLQKIFYKKNFGYDTIINDIQAVDTMMKAMGDLLFESGRYDIVIPENRFLPFEKNAFMTVEMPWDEVKTICDTFNTDAVLSVDHFKTRVITDYHKDSYYSPVDGNFYQYSGAEIKISYIALLRVYDPSIEKIVYRKFLRDTIFWNDIGSSASSLFEHFTPVKKALTETGIAIAIDFADEISTVWRQERRYIFYKGGSELKQASDLAEANQWAPAMALWKKVAEESSSKSLRSKAEMNIAVGYELQGDIDEAIAWALKSYETMYRTTTYNYLETLKYRKNEIKKQ